MKLICSVALALAILIQPTKGLGVMFAHLVSGQPIEKWQRQPNCKRNQRRDDGAQSQQSNKLLTVL
jgi:hypothetical protein